MSSSTDLFCSLSLTPLLYLALSLQASNVFGSRGPRKMRVYVPRVFPDNTRATFQPLADKDSILGMVNRNETMNVVQLINKPPKWNDREFCVAAQHRDLSV